MDSMITKRDLVPVTLEEGLIKIELYRYGTIDDLFGKKNRSQEEERLEARRVELCRALSLTDQVTFDEKPYIPYQLISPADYEIWKKFLPRSYSSRSSEWNRYVYDKIPISVLEEINRAKELKCFSRLIIRTPESKIIDPICIGFVNDECYLIARWGESLIPFEEIKRLVKRGWIRKVWDSFLSLKVFDK